jgi:hypothetical protein
MSLSPITEAMPIRISYPDEDDVTAMIQTCTREVLGSNAGLDALYSGLSLG